MPRRALLSVSDKSGLPDFARGLAALDFELYSTGGTLEALKEAGGETRSVPDIHNLPVIMDVRVKTSAPVFTAACSHAETILRTWLPWRSWA